MLNFSILLVSITYSLFILTSTFYTFSKGINEYFCFQKRFGPTRDTNVVNFVREIRLSPDEGYSSLYPNVSVSDNCYVEKSKGLDPGSIGTWFDTVTNDDSQVKIFCFIDRHQSVQVSTRVFTKSGNFWMYDNSIESNCSMRCTIDTLYKNCSTTESLQNRVLITLFVISLILPLICFTCYLKTNSYIFRRVLRIFAVLFNKDGEIFDFCNPMDNNPYYLEMGQEKHVLSTVDNLVGPEISQISFKGGHAYFEGQDLFNIIEKKRSNLSLYNSTDKEIKVYRFSNSQVKNIKKYFWKISERSSLCCVSGEDHYLSFDNVFESLESNPDLFVSSVSCTKGSYILNPCQDQGIISRCDSKEVIDYVLSSETMKFCLSTVDEKSSFCFLYSKLLFCLVLHNLFFFNNHLFCGLNKFEILKSFKKNTKINNCFKENYSALQKCLSGETFYNKKPLSCLNSQWKKYTFETCEIKKSLGFLGHYFGGKSLLSQGYQLSIEIGNSLNDSDFKKANKNLEVPFKLKSILEQQKEKFIEKIESITSSAKEDKKEIYECVSIPISKLKKEVDEIKSGLSVHFDEEISLLNVNKYPFLKHKNEPFIKGKIKTHFRESKDFEGYKNDLREKAKELETKAVTLSKHNLQGNQAEPNKGGDWTLVKSKLEFLSKENSKFSDKFSILNRKGVLIKNNFEELSLIGDKELGSIGETQNLSTEYKLFSQNIKSNFYSKKKKKILERSGKKGGGSSKQQMAEKRRALFKKLNKRGKVQGDKSDPKVNINEEVQKNLGLLEFKKYNRFFKNVVSLSELFLVTKSLFHKNTSRMGKKAMLERNENLFGIKEDKSDLNQVKNYVFKFVSKVMNNTLLSSYTGSEGAITERVLKLINETDHKTVRPLEMEGDPFYEHISECRGNNSTIRRLKGDIDDLMYLKMQASKKLNILNVNLKNINEVLESLSKVNLDSEEGNDSKGKKEIVSGIDNIDEDDGLFSLFE